MLIANSDSSSSFLSRSPTKPNWVEPSSPIASLTLSSPDRDRRDDDDQGSLSTEASNSPRNSDGSPSSPVNLHPERQIPPLDHPRSDKASEDIDDELWNSCSPSDGSDDHISKTECIVKPSLRLKQEPTGVGAGLWNLGNTCFINSVLQCITHTVPLIKSLHSYKYHDPCNCNQLFCVVKTLRDHIDVALRPSSYPLSPYYFLDNLNYFSPEFQRYQQEDAHEFLQAFLNKLERCCLDRTSYQDVNIVEQVFGGRLISRLRCCNCNSVSETFESSLGLSLEIEDVENLQSALESFTRVEKLDEKLTCDDCEEKVSKEKQLLLDKLPLVATFHLKRFKNNGFFTEKVFNHVKIPLELDLQPYMRSSLENQVPTKYHLYALVKHLGISLAYGHYSSYVRSAPEIWHHFDDVQVTRIDEERVLSEDSYILFYAREGTPWFSRAFEEEMQPLLEANNITSSPKSVLDPTSGECSSESSDENVDKHNKTEESSVFLSEKLREDVFLSAESSSGNDSPMDDLFYSLDYFDFENQDPSPRQHEGTFHIRVEEEAWEQPLLVSEVAESKETEVAHRDTMKKCSPRGRELGQADSSSGSPPKKIKMDTEEISYQVS